MVPMMMPNSMMQQQQQQHNGGMMPGMNQSFNMQGMSMMGPQNSMLNQIQSSQGHQNHQQQLQHHPATSAGQLNNTMNAPNTQRANTPNANGLNQNQMPFLHGQTSHGNGNGNAQVPSMNPSQMGGMQMAVFNPITNAWNAPQQQQQQQQHGHSNANGAPSHSQGHANANANPSGNNGHGSGSGNDNGSFSYGGNLAHCA